MRQSLKSTSKKQIAEQRAGQARAAAASAARTPALLGPAANVTLDSILPRIRYAITKPEPPLPGDDGEVVRVICAGVFDTKEQADVQLAAIYTNNSAERLRSVYGNNAISLAVRPVECWANGEPKGIYTSAHPPTEREQAIARLREWVKPGDTIYCILRHVTRSGGRTVQLVHFPTLGSPDAGVKEWRSVEPQFLGFNAALALGLPYDKQREGIRVGSPGYNTALYLVDKLAKALGFQPTPTHPALTYRWL